MVRFESEKNIFLINLEKTSIYYQDSKTVLN